MKNLRSLLCDVILFQKELGEAPTENETSQLRTWLSKVCIDRNSFQIHADALGELKYKDELNLISVSLIIDKGLDRLAAKWLYVLAFDLPALRWIADTIEDCNPCAWSFRHESNLS